MDKRAIKKSINRFNERPEAFDRRDYTVSEKNKLLEFMSSGEPFAAVGKIDDCVTGNELNAENVGYRRDGFIWTSQDIYHVKHYNAAVVDSFLALALHS